MHILLTVLIIVVCILLVLIVLVQNSKGGGLASNFAASNQFMGVRRTTDFLEKATWTLAGALLVFSLLATVTVPKEKVDPRSRVEGQFDESLLNNPSTNTITLPEAPAENNPQE